MSGIAGIISRNEAPVNLPLLRWMTNGMAFRGPDAQDIWSEGHVGFGHALLRTTRESAHERQPFSFDKLVWITADARVDRRADLIRKLDAGGNGSLPVTSASSLKTAADVELVLRAYYSWGERCVEHLLGDFSFAIWDGWKQRLFCARDHFGIKPFYYAETKSAFVFSNTLSTVRAHPEVTDELNEHAIGDFLLFCLNQEAGTTTFADVQRLPPAHTLTWEAGRITIRRYWRLPTDGHIRYKHASDYVENFRQIFDEAVSDRLRTEKVAVSMSGGLDSTSVAATAMRLLSNDVGHALSAFTIVYDHLIPDRERHYAQLAADSIGIPVNFLVADEYKLFDGWDEPEVRGPEPSQYALSILITKLIRNVAGQSRVLLCGDGGDPALLFSRHYFEQQIKSLRWGNILRYGARHLRDRRRLPPFGFRTMARGLLNRGEPETLGHTYPSWLDDVFASRLDLPARFEQYNRKPGPVHRTRPEAYNYLTSTYWPQDCFERLDPGITGVAVEYRYTFFDLRLVEFLLAIPPLPWIFQKEILRKAMRGRLPEQIRHRPKTPLVADPGEIMLRNGDVRWATSFETAPELARFVKREIIPPITGSESYDELWLNIRPFSLNYWLCRFRESKFKFAQETFYGPPEQGCGKAHKLTG